MGFFTEVQNSLSDLNNYLGWDEQDSETQTAKTPQDILAQSTPVSISPGISLPLLPLLLQGCYSLPEASTLSNDGPFINVTDLKTTSLDAIQPTDLLLRDDGSYIVLDGYQNRFIVNKENETSITTIQGKSEWGAPVRIAEKQDAGFWLTYPGGSLDKPGRVVAIDDNGIVLNSFLISLGLPDHEKFLAPLGIKETKDGLVVGGRYGELVKVDKENGNIIWASTKDIDNHDLLSLSDVILNKDKILAVDSLGKKVHVFNQDGTPDNYFGHFGMWVGKMFQPKSVTTTPSNRFLVADSALNVVQLFDTNGRNIGVLSDKHDMIRFDHATTIRASKNNENHYYVLDERESTLVEFTLSTKTEKDSLAYLDKYFLRTPLLPNNYSVAGKDGENCYQCHDGFYNDTRENWDENLFHHPVNMKPSFETPDSFPLYDGAITCVTCHSPHGDSSTHGAVSNTSGKKLSSGTFTRVDATHSEMCVECHTDEAHKKARDINRANQTKPLPEEYTKSHPQGDTLKELLIARNDPLYAELASDIGAGCFMCHKPHGADTEKLVSESKDSSVCKTCHEEKTVESLNHFTGSFFQDEGSPVKVTDSKNDISQSSIGCGTCHDLADGSETSLLRDFKEDTFCLDCHEEQNIVLEKPHGNVTSETGVLCLACHDIHVDSDKASQSSIETFASLTKECGECHTGHVKNGNPNVNTRHVTDNGTSKLSGCQSCHGEAHDIVKEEAKACSTCHPNEQKEKNQGGHSKVSCNTCHPPHKTPVWQRSNYADQNPASRPCLTCHGPESNYSGTVKIENYTHTPHIFKPSARFGNHSGLTLFDSRGNPLPDNQSGYLECQSCHEEHAPSSDVSLIDRKKQIKGSVAKVCGACHPDGEKQLKAFH